MATAELKHGTWILAADGARAILMRNNGNGVKPNFAVIQKYEQANPPTREQGTDRPGRTNDADTHKSAMEPTDWHQQAEDRFVHRIAGVLESAFDRHEYDALIIVAPPVALGEMRKSLPGKVRDRVIIEINKDLTHLSVPELEAAIVKHLSPH